MTAKEHYDKHLGKVYSWMLGDFHERMSEQKEFFLNRRILPSGTSLPLTWAPEMNSIRRAGKSPLVVSWRDLSEERKG